MKRQSIFLSLIILVTLFLHFTPRATTYAYFMDSTRVASPLKLKLGTIALAPFESQSITVKEANQVKTITTAIRNRGTLDAKITLKEMIIQENNQVIHNVADYFELTTNTPTEKLGPGETTPFTVKLTKKAQWTSSVPVTVAFKFFFSQIGLSEADRGFIDEQTFFLTINNEAEVIPPVVAWPEDKYFTGNFYVKQNAYYSIVDSQLTTVIPGEIYVKAANLTASQIEDAKANIRLLRGQTENYTYNINYIGNKGFRLSEINLTGGIATSDSSTATLSGTNSMNINFKDGGKLGIWNHSIDAFSQPFLLSSDKRDTESALIKSPIEVPQKGVTLPLAFVIYNNQAQSKWRSLTQMERTYLQNNLSLALTTTTHYQASFQTDYSGLNVWRESNSPNHYADIELKKNNQVVFRRKLAPASRALVETHALETGTLDSTLRPPSAEQASSSNQESTSTDSSMQQATSPSTEEMVSETSVSESNFASDLSETVSSKEDDLAIFEEP